MLKGRFGSFLGVGLALQSVVGLLGTFEGLGRALCAETLNPKP